MVRLIPLHNTGEKISLILLVHRRVQRNRRPKVDITDHTRGDKNEWV